MSHHCNLPTKCVFSVSGRHDLLTDSVCRTNHCQRNYSGVRMGSLLTTLTDRI